MNYILKVQMNSCFKLNQSIQFWSGFIQAVNGGGRIYATLTAISPTLDPTLHFARFMASSSRSTLLLSFSTCVLCLYICFKMKKFIHHVYIQYLIVVCCHHFVNKALVSKMLHVFMLSWYLVCNIVCPGSQIRSRLITRNDHKLSRTTKKCWLVVWPDDLKIIQNVL